MPPKKGQKGSENQKKAEKKDLVTTDNDEPEEEPVVAVILADSYDDCFAPLTCNTPRCLLPLANVPLLHYSIESAVRTGVAHIYILARSHVHMIRQHVSDVLAPNLQALQNIAITVINTPEARSEGDALRELDAKQILRSDFILYRSDSVCTLDLSPIVEEHRARRKIDKDAIMTMCNVSERGTKASESVQTPIYYIEPSTNQLLHFEMLSYEDRPDAATLPIDLVRLNEKTGYEELQLRADLLETGVEICSIDVSKASLQFT